MEAVRERMGTGWLVGRDVMITNNQVIDTVARAKQLRAEFNYQLNEDGSPATADLFGFDPDGFFYTNAALDFTLVKVKCKPWVINLPLRVERTEDGHFMVLDEAAAGPVGPDGVVTPLNVGPIGLTPPVYKFCTSAGSRWGNLQLPTSGVVYADEQHVNIVQHPKGRRKEVAVQQNQISGLFPTRVRYTTDTEPGSSGSPVFDNQWDLMAIHHAGGEYSDGRWKNNQGVRIDKIVADLQANHAAGSWVRNQLGI